MADAIYMLALTKRLPCIKLATVQIIYYCEVRRVLDPIDNYAPKFILDSLVKARLLEDDRGDWVNVLPVRIKIDHKRPRTEVFIRKTKAN